MHTTLVDMETHGKELHFLYHIHVRDKAGEAEHQPIIPVMLHKLPEDIMPHAVHKLGKNIRDQWHDVVSMKMVCTAHCSFAHTVRLWYSFTVLIPAKPLTYIP